jgi:hypothetical protein
VSQPAWPAAHRRLQSREGAKARARSRARARAKTRGKTKARAKARARAKEKDKKFHWKDQEQEREQKQEQEQEQEQESVAMLGPLITAMGKNAVEAVESEFTTRFLFLCGCSALCRVVEYCIFRLRSYVYSPNSTTLRS